MSTHQLHSSSPFFARMIRRLSVPIIVAWLAIIAFLIICVPSLEQVAQERSMSLYPTDAPYFKAVVRMTADFKQSDSGDSGGNSTMIVLEGQQALGDDAHKYYDRLIAELKDDPNACAAHSEFLG